MALVRFGSLVQAASGRVGSLCFSRQAGAAIVRTQPLQRSHDSAVCLDTRARFSQVRATWRDLPESTRLPWLNAAKTWKAQNRLGLNRQLSAFTWFSAAAMREITLGFGISTSLNNPASFDWPIIPTVEIWPDGPMNVSFASTSIYPPPHCTVRAQRFVSTYNQLPGRMWRVIARGPWQLRSINMWDAGDIFSPAHAPGLTGCFGVPARLEWFLVEVVQWISAWGPAFVTRHLAQIPNVGPELVYNARFQTLTTPPTGWTSDQAGALTSSGFDPYGDNSSGMWELPDLANGKAWYTAGPYRFSLTRGASYTFSMAYKTASANITSIKLYGTGMTTITLYAPPPPTAGAWARVSKQFTPNANATGSYLYFNSNAHTPCTFFIDNISIRKNTF